MIWVYIFIYFLVGIITGLCVYVYYVKKYLKEKSLLTFRYWMKYKYENIFISGFLWCVSVPVLIIMYPSEKIIKKIVKRINKHYNVEL